MDNASKIGFVSDYNNLYSANNYIGVIGSDAATTLAELQALSSDLHSINENTIFTSIVNNQVYPVTPISIGYNLGEPYNIGLDILLIVE